MELSKPLTLLICVHNHQPVGNFGWVYEEAYKRAYLPFLDALEAHPGIRLTLHYSGSLLDWIMKNHPEFIKRIKRFVEMGTVEILGGGYYEPIFSIIPGEDRIGQIKCLTSAIKRCFGFIPNGCWLPERVWEPDVIKSFTKARITYTIVDDTHFRSAPGIDVRDGEILGYYVTEEEGFKLFIFPSSKTLRYYIPFKLPDETIKLLREIARRDLPTCITFADDGEKFGFWPHTYKWVYEEGWLERFFKELEANMDWINFSTFNEYINHVGPMGRVYLPQGSYDEMMEWSGGYFKNFLVRYPEANNMHKKMLYVSDKISHHSPAVTSHQKMKVKKAIIELYKGQCNCAYWHGVFGGLYLRHLRQAVYSHLIESEKLIEESRYLRSSPNKFRQIDIFDFDKDGYNEIILESSSLNVYIDPADGGSLFELDYKPNALNLLDTITRREEIYHKKIKERLGQKEERACQPLSIHDIGGIKEAGLESNLIYDRYKRNSLLDHLLPDGIGLEDFMSGDYKALGNFIGSSYQYKIHKNSISLMHNELTKSIKLIQPAGLEVDYRVKKYAGLRFGVEFNIALQDPDFNFAGKLENRYGVILNDRDRQFRLEYQFNIPVDIWHYPIETLSWSERGLEKTYQGLCFLFHCKMDSVPDDILRFSICLKFSND